MTLVKAALPAFVLVGGFIGLQYAAAHAAREQSERAAWAILGVGTGLLIAAGTLFVLFGLRGSIRTARARAARSVVVPGAVVTVNRAGVQGDINDTVRPVVRFATAAGEQQELEVAFNEPGLAIGDQVTVRYDPEDATWVALVGGAGDRAARWAKRALVGAVAVSLLTVGAGVLKGMTGSPLTTVEQRTAEAAKPPADAGRKDEGSPLIFIGGFVLFGGLGAWSYRDVRGKHARHRARRARALEVNATITALNLSAAKNKAQPSFTFRTFEGEDRTSRSHVIYNGKKDLAQLQLGAPIRIQYDPQAPEWVIPASLSQKDERRIWRGAYLNPVVFGFFAALSAVALFLPS